MFRKLSIIAIGASVSLSGCGGASLLGEPTEAEQKLTVAQAHRENNPTGRFEVAGKREYSNGTEIYVLDTQSGQLCYFFVASGKGDETAQKSDMQSCAGSALAPQS